MCLCIFTHQAKTLEEKQKQSVTMCTVANNVEKSRLISYTCPHSFTPLASKASMPQRCGRDYSKEASNPCKRSAARRRNDVKTGSNRPTVTSRQYGRRAVFVSGDVRFQDGDVVDLANWGTVFYRFSVLSFNVCTCAKVCFHKVHT